MWKHFTMFFDTHAHFDDGQGEYSTGAMLERARQAGVTRILAVGGSKEMNRAALDAARAFPKQVIAAIGFDRDQTGLRGVDLSLGWSNALGDLVAGAAGQGIRVTAIGEIGLDFHYHPETAAAQVELFRQQLDLARELRLPVIVHSRQADAETARELGRHAQSLGRQAGRVGVLHCFTGDARVARELLEIGFFISFSGIVTFRNASPLRAVAREIPEDRLLIETDTPYLAPVPQRGRRNEPAFLPYVAAALAEARGSTVGEIAELTTANAERLFLETRNGG